MRKSKNVGFAIICLGIVLMVGAAVLPISPATQQFGPFRVDIRGDNCGPAGYVAFRDTNAACQQDAQRRLMVSTGIGVLIVALGMAIFAGGDDQAGSRIGVPTPRVSRRAMSRGRGSTRYRPG